VLSSKEASIEVSMCAPSKENSQFLTNNELKINNDISDDVGNYVDVSGYVGVINDVSDG
jgi:hypothetical protein